MGLFSSKFIFTAYAGSSILLEEETREDTVHSLMLQGIISNAATTSEAITLGLQTNMYARARSMMKYAKRSDGYYYGIPEATHDGDDEYLPIAVLMHDREWFDEQGLPDLPPTTKRLLKRLTLDPYEIKEEYIAQVEEAIENGERPGTDQLDDWDLFLYFGAPAKSNIRGTLEYIWHYLQFIPTVNIWTYREDYEAFLASPVGDQPASNFHLSEGEGSDKDWTVTATGYEIFYAWSYIETIDVPGEYTPAGWTEPLKNNHCHGKFYQLGDPDYVGGIEMVHGSGAPVATSQPEGQYHTYYIVTRALQDEAGEPYHRHVLIMAPSMMYVINVTEEAEPTDFQYVDVPLFPDDPEQETEFKWPVHFNTLKEVSVMHREEMLQDSLCITAFLVEEVKVKWYQKTFFKWLIIIIVIIVVVLAWQYELLPTIAAMAGAATGATALGLWALYVVMTFAIGFLISFAGSLIGGKWGMVFIIIATLLLVGGNPFGNLSTTWGNITTAPGWGSAFAFIQATTPFLQLGMTFYQDYALGKLESEMRDFTQTAKEKYQELKDAWESFGDMPGWLDPMTLIAAHQTWYVEKPDDYFARTLNANPGLLGYDLINNFAEIALTLPEDGNDTDIIEGMFNEFEKQRGAA